MKLLTDEVVQRAGKQVFAFVQEYWDHFPTLKNTEIHLPFPQFITGKLDIENVREFLANAVAYSAADVRSHEYEYIIFGLFTRTILFAFGYFIWKRRQDME